MRRPRSIQSLRRLIETIKKSRRILVSTHQLPDGDGLGAETALYHYLRKAGKSVQICNPDPPPGRYKFLDPSGKILKSVGKKLPWNRFDCWIIVDTNDPRRLGKLWPELSVRAKKIVFLDHHVELSQNDSYPPHATCVADKTSSSIGELLDHVFTEWGAVKLDAKISLGLYVSVMTDTNSFRYARTTPAAHAIAARSIEQGVNPETIYQAIYSSKQVSHLKLLGRMLETLKVDGRGKIAWFEMPLSERKRFGASADDTQSFLNFLLLLKDAELVCLFREEDDRRIRVSIKSKGTIKVESVASELGGGGHEYAAGLSLALSMRETVRTVVDRLTMLL